MANPPSVVPPGRYQFEMGLESYLTGEIEVRYLPTVLFRTGIWKDVELRAGAAWQDVRSEDSPEEDGSGVSPFVLGTKVRFMEQEGLRPNGAIAVNLGLAHTGRHSFQTPRFASSIALEFDQDLGGPWNLNYNAGYGWDGETTNGLATWALCMNFQASRPLSLFVETYGAVPDQGGSVAGIDAGAALLLTPSMQVDASLGVADGPDEPNHFFALGFSFAVR